MKSLMDRPKYKSFVTDRNRFLDVVNNKNRLIVSDVLRGTFSHIAYGIKSAYQRLENKKFDYGLLKPMLKQCEDLMTHVLDAANHEITRLTKENRQQIFDFTYASEIEAIKRVTGKSPKHVKPDSQTHKPMSSGGTVENRIGFVFDKLKRNLLTSIQQSAIIERPTEEMLLLLVKKFPDQKVLIRPPRALKPPQIKEATYTRKDTGATVDSDYVDEATWEIMRDKYMDDYIPKFRGPEHTIDGDIPAAEGESEYYAWELEQHLTDDFVNQVRDGQVQAANDLGISDFMWIAIVDDKTDDCCLWRDGLTSEQIEAELTGGDHQDDDYDSVVPPAHFNCRCDMAPVPDDMPEAPASDIGDFDDWLNE